MTKEEHRERYVVLLGRIVKALEMSEEERAPHARLFARLFARLVEDCTSERIKAVSPWVFGDKPVERSDPLRRSVDDTFGTVVEVAQGIVDARRLDTSSMSVEEVLISLGATLVEEPGPKAQATSYKTRALAHGEEVA